MKKKIYILFAITIFTSCDKQTVGYMNVDKASFNPDLLEIYTLNSADEKDKTRLDHNIPWVSFPIQGVEGTFPIFYSIEQITEKNSGSISEITKFAKVRGDGAIEIPQENNIPNGEYNIFLRAKNEGYSKKINSPLRVIVKK
jgi:hypothetical protein